MLLEKFLKPTNSKRVLFFLTFDVFISLATIALAYLLRFNFSIPDEFYPSMFCMIFILLPIKIISLLYFKIYFVAWRYFGLIEYKRLLLAHALAYTLFFTIFLTFNTLFTPFPRSVIFIDLFLSLFFIGFLRISRRVYLESFSNKSYNPTLIYGINDNTSSLIKSAKYGDIAYDPVVMITDIDHIIDTYISDIKVYAKSDLERVIREYEIQSVIISNIIEQKELDRLYQHLKDLGIQEIKIAQILQNETKLQDISIEDLLARKPKDLDMISIANFIAGKVVMITGAGGSIGSELSRQVALFGAEKIILLDHSEYNLYQISEELSEKSIVSVMLSVKDREDLEKVFMQYLPDVVIHAAAYKHVPLCEENIESAVENNVFGTKNVIDLSVKYEAKKFVLISTDKAVRPTNVMGTTKRICELYAHAVPSNKTEIVAVRFGNVLGSSGSVIPKFQAQIENGQNITVTHPDITRYFMMIPEACQLVLQSASIAKGGELFILDMGEPIKIVDLAKRMIELSGRDDIKIEFTGLRAGEKLYEELLIDDADLKTEYDSILVSKNPPVDYQELISNLEDLKIENRLKILKKIVPEFNHNK